ncbi:MAG TPA: AMP-binding protein, partial [Opitutaceae bacterium]|nr:AMP-binding protein [Opitutaceae bacterium]
MSETLRSQWADTVRAAPDALAIVDGATGSRVTRAELDDRANRWREKYGATLAGQTVVLAEPNGVDWFCVFLGLLRSDAVVVPLDPGEPRSAQQATAAAIRAGWLWTGGVLESIASRPRAAGDGRRIVKLTSGSTGTPRALRFTDAQMLADGRQVCAGMDIRANDVN